MIRWIAAFLLGLVCFAVAGGEARAEAPKSRAVFALIVTNNHSIELGRPDLHYADDDGVKYAEVFRMLAPEANVHLLTELDRDSALLFPHLKGKLKPPTRAEVTATAAVIAHAVADVRKLGVEVDFYFVFAGHGDVDHGKGFLELRDSRFTSDDVEALLKSVPSTRAHVILDSCNSFFVLNARKPGGRRVGVSEDAAKSLHERLPNVGVFLSTSAEAEVFEWSELQSGIFSHAVRSGITGAADANRDGMVSYDELRAFVDLASSKVKNPLYRPKVFARGPHGRAEQPIVVLAGISGRRVTIDAEPRVRVTVRDVDELPWIDVHKEEGAAMDLWIPARVAERASIEERDAGDLGGARVRERRTLEGLSAEGPIRLADAKLVPPSPSMRSANDVLRNLFAAPFGPRAMAAYQVEASKTSEQVYGVSHEDVERMRLLLAQVADIGKGERHLIAAVGLTAGVASVGFSIDSFVLGARSHDPWRYVDGALQMTGAVASLTFGGVALFHRSYGEHLHASFVNCMATSSDPAKVVAATERRLFELANTNFRLRRVLRGVGIAAVSFGGFGLTAALLPGGKSENRRSLIYASAEVAIAGAFAIAYGFIPTPVERMANLWSTDPAITRIPRFSLAPTIGAGTFGLQGTF
ncbi:Hypothetical protein A7982_11286 [Minicystis rosea]|nr:Hypothetical protein A7982_11286 [Minicystis rosea]